MCEVGINWISKAAGDQHVDSLISLAKIYLDGVYVERDKIKAIECLTKASEQNSVQAYHLLGKVLLEGERVSLNIANDAIRKLEKASEKGNLDSSYILGNLYLEGKYIGEKNHLMGLKYLTGAADKDHANSQYVLAKVNYEGKHVKQNCERAVALFIESLEKKDDVSNKLIFSDAEELIGDIYHRGCTGINKDIGEAISWYRKADVKGNPSAQYKLYGIMSELENVQSDSQVHNEERSEL